MTLSGSEMTESRLLVILWLVDMYVQEMSYGSAVDFKDRKRQSIIVG